MGLRRIVAVAVSLAVIAYAGTATIAPIEVEAGGCVKKVGYADWFPQQNADGAKARWILRTLDADDWALGGFASEVLWVGTDDDFADFSWVEVGATHGWQGQDQYVFYSARMRNGDPTTYKEFKYTTVPHTGDNVWFKVYKTAPDIYRAEITVGSTIEPKAWGNHHTKTVNYSAGLEATCDTSQINRTNVTANSWHRISDGLWINPTGGGIVEPAGTIVEWCQFPIQVRYAMNSLIDPNVC